jgi:CarboxypepD_reg-like domain
MYKRNYNKNIFNLNKVTIVLILISMLYQIVRAGSKEGNKSVIETINFTVTVTDKETSDPLQLVSVILKKKNTIVAAASTNPFGRAEFRDIQSDIYEISTRFIGYVDFKDTITIDKSHKSIAIQVNEKNIQLKEIEIKGNRINNNSNATIDIISGQQTFDLESYHSAPTGSVIQLVQENLVGTAKAPTGEIHIRGQHGEFTYLIDGIPIPLGVFGGLNEIVDPQVISKVTFYTGGFPAEYGGQIAGLMDIQSRVPPGKFHLDFSTYGGSYVTSGDSLGSRVGTLKELNTNGQSISLSDHFGKLGIFFTGSRQETDRRIDPPIISLFHDHGFDYFAYGKFD